MVEHFELLDWAFYSIRRAIVRQMKSRPRKRQRGTGGFSIIEVLMVLLASTIVVAIAIPKYQTMKSGMQVTSTANAIAGAVSQTRYKALMNSQIYTLTITAPANTYVSKNISTGVSDSAIPLPSSLVQINGGTSATYTFTLCPSGTVFGSGGVCPGATTPPAISATYQGRQTNVTVSGVGNVTTTTIN